MKKEVIIEKHSKIDGRSIYFEKYRDDKLIKTSKVISLVKEKDNYKYIVLLNSQGKTIFETYKYLNDGIGQDTWKKREKAMQSLKIFFSFVELFNIKNYKMLSINDFNKFNMFLKGGIQIGNSLDLKCITIRQTSTINQYMSVYRGFFTYIGIKDSVFQDKKLLGTSYHNSATSSGYNTQVEKYNSNKAIPKIKRVPKYIRVNEYVEILKLIDSEDTKYSLREEIIVRLMFEYGLRLSEVLGLTIEDIFDTVEDGNNEYGKIILRNRVSDKSYHHCKNLIIPKTESEYKSNEYSQEKIGYHTVIVTSEIIELIREYIDDTRDVMSMTYTAVRNISESKADKIELLNEGNNYYIFINKNYKPLSKSGWNKIIREIYEDVGIELDKGVKKNNLSHRLRHGFAMLCRQNNVDRYTLKELLRHRNVSTVDIYFNPTVEDNIEIAIEVSKIIKRVLNINIEHIASNLTI